MADTTANVARDFETEDMEETTITLGAHRPSPKYNGGLGLAHVLHFETNLDMAMRAVMGIAVLSNVNQRQSHTTGSTGRLSNVNPR